MSATNYQQSGLERQVYYQFINRVYQLTNDERQKQNLPLFKLNSKLCQAAQIHSQHMAEGDFFAHRSKDKSTPADRVSAVGYHWSQVAENIAAGSRTPEEVVTGWLNSRGHRANILNPKLQEIGIGVCYLAHDPGKVTYHYYWTQVFGTPW